MPAATRREPYAVRDSRHMPTVTPTVHLSAAVTFFQSPSPSFCSVATASWAFPSNCLASASVFAPMDFGRCHPAPSRFRCGRFLDAARTRGR